LVDYGGGSGLLSFLALEAGIGTVIYNDIYDVSCEDARKLGQALHLPLSRIVCGDVDELVSYLRKEKINVNAIVSYYSVNYETYICDGVEYPQIWANEVIIGPHIQPAEYFSNPAKLKNQP